MLPMSRKSFELAACFGVALLICPRPAAAQNTAVAEALFQDAQKLLTAGRVHEACAKFAESQRDDPGLGTLLRLALCHEKEGKTATAWAEFEDAAAQAQRRNEADRESFARAHAAALDRSLDRVVIQVETRPANMRLVVDGGEVGLGVLGTALPLDPGDHVIEASAPGKRAWATRLSLAPGGARQDVLIPSLEDEQHAAAAPTPSEARTARTLAAPAPAQQEETQAASTWRTVGWATGGAGVVLVGLAAYFQLTALSRYDDSHNTTDPTRGQQLYSDASQNQLLAQIAGAAGILAIGTGVVLLVVPGASRSDGKRASVVPAVAANGAAVVVRSDW
jgi:hypothetical protein